MTNNLVERLEETVKQICDINAPYVPSLDAAALMGEAAERITQLEADAKRTWAEAFRKGYDRGKADEKDAKEIDSYLGGDTLES